MKPPTIEKVGDVWRVTYAGMIKEHRQEWQARVFYEQAIQLYNRRKQRVF
jgi:hypothetical protein